MRRYRLQENYRDDEISRNRFYDFVAAVFPGADFRTWHDHGFWFDRYIPHSLFEDGRIIANVSATFMPLLLDGTPAWGLQIGTVGTIPEHRGKGLSRQLMEHVLEKYGSSIDIVFLFANDEVVEFYPRFGFDTWNEAVFVAHRLIAPAPGCSRQLNVNRAADLAFLRERLERRLPLSRLFGATDHTCITLWHALNIFPEHIYYIEAAEAIAIASIRQGTLDVYDLIFERLLDLETVLSALVETADVRSIRCHFSPDVVSFHHDSLESPEDSTLFVKGAFPVGGKTFKFPFTAQT